jgi:hypothetical protein
MDIQPSQPLTHLSIRSRLQGVVLGGLVNLYTITGNRTLLNVATSIASATLVNLIYPNGMK